MIDAETPTSNGRVALRDALGRPLQDLRISVTDRCNFRCRYCMPREVFGPGFAFLPRQALLTFEEIERIARVFVRLGVRKIRLTGGEPLLRRDLEQLVARLAAIEGVKDLAMTTNGFLLSEAKARALKAAGLGRVTVSLDALDPNIFGTMNGVGVVPTRILAAVAHARAAGLRPVKVNAVVQRGTNEDAVEELAAHFRGTDVVVRFIEYMDVGTTNGWRMDDVVSADEIVARIGRRWPLVPVPPSDAAEVARRYRYVDGQGEIGVIASVTRPFCGACSRARLSAEGELFTCLFGAHGLSLRDLVRGGADDRTLLDHVARVWYGRRDRYSEERTLRTDSTAQDAPERIEMFRIGG